jgi:hypothetical protein
VRRRGLWALVSRVSFLVPGIGWWSGRRRNVKGAENGEWLNGERRVWRRRGSEKGEAGRRVQEVQTQTPKSGFTDPRRKVRGEPNAGVRSQIPRPDFVVHRGPEERPDLQSRRPPRDDQGQGDRKKIVFAKPARRFRQNFFFLFRFELSVRAITVFFLIVLILFLMVPVIAY